ncbi:MAG: ATP-binding protein [Bacteroidales bacterium]|nr:ATP-binding protein [Bacteroidales bacterium]
MIYRKIELFIKNWLDSSSQKALLITGARQVGKTFSIRKALKENAVSFVEINFLENAAALQLFQQTTNTQDLLRGLSVLAGKPLKKGETVFFFDEVQCCKEIVTAIKFLVDEGSYKYIMSGSLLGVELKDIRSFPVGYLDIKTMYPLDFEEFMKANNFSDEVFAHLKNAYANLSPVDDFIHQQIMKLFHLYLIVGGMPAAVDIYLKNNNIAKVIEVQKSIIDLYKKDIAQYDPKEKLYLDEILMLIPSEINSKNKRFVLKNLNENQKFSRYENRFLWLRDAGVALPTYCANEPALPLMLSKSRNLFKLFLNDIGLLCAMYANGIQLKILQGEININFGAVYENFVAQELTAHQFDLYYYNSKKNGEIDFMIEHNAVLLPLEVKSGKDYIRHVSMTHLLTNEHYGIAQGIILQNDNISVKEKAVYLPIYMTMFIENEQVPENLIYRVEAI